MASCLEEIRYLMSTTLLIIHHPTHTHSSTQHTLLIHPSLSSSHLWHTSSSRSPSSLSSSSSAMPARMVRTSPCQCWLIFLLFTPRFAPCTPRQSTAAVGVPRWPWNGIRCSPLQWRYMRVPRPPFFLVDLMEQKVKMTRCGDSLCSSLAHCVKIAN